MRNFIYILTIFTFISIQPIVAQDQKREYKESSYQNQSFYDVTTFPQMFKRKTPKNIILMIGDGMGVAQVYAGMTANRGNLFLNNFKYVGFSRTQSANRYVTDSGAGGNAIATGHKANNSAVGVDGDGNPVPSVLKIAQENGLATGVVVTTNVLDATPADFVAHVTDRDMMPEIALQFVNSGPDVFIGAGKEYFVNRTDGRNLVAELSEKGYQVCDTITELVKFNSGKLAGFLTEKRVSERGDQLAVTSNVALNILDDNKKGFFLMIEGSKIDDGGHDNDIGCIAEEMLDFDRTIGKVLEFAAKDGETLVVVTADHETGGLTLVNGDMKTGKITGRFTTEGHTGVMVPVFAYGPGAEEFGGISENTSFYNKFIKLLKLKQ